ncbi:hypothetical protein EGYY_06630 [Eggerthella sp. YY7918]|nr:hypothetical protein EGYY_06630 [Eggerthella sp. YY7918]
MEADKRKRLQGVEVIAPSRGLLGRAHLLIGIIGVVTLIVLGSVVVSSAWARSTENNFVDNAAGVAETETAALSSSEETPGSEAESASSCSLDVPALLQNPELPTGCESVALVNALQFYGFNVEKTEIADLWLARSDYDFVHAFLGNPYDTSGFACMAPALVEAANAYLEAQDSSLHAEEKTGSSFSDVLALVATGRPVIVWCTIDLAEPSQAYQVAYENGNEYRLLQPSHCVVISGYDLDSGVVYVSDSLVGQTSYPLDLFATRYYQLGAQAIVIS